MGTRAVGIEWPFGPVNTPCLSEVEEQGCKTRSWLLISHAYTSVRVEFTSPLDAYSGYRRLAAFRQRRAWVLFDRGKQ